MGTRGLFGFRKNGVDKAMYSHFDSYPRRLGYTIAAFVSEHTPEEMSDLFDKIELVDGSTKPTNEQIALCKKYYLYDFTVSSCSPEDWYCLLRNLQGQPDRLFGVAQAEGKVYMSNDIDLIRKSGSCEYAYIINLDDGVLEFYKGFQRLPDYYGRYGTKKCDGYYPCSCLLTIPFSDIGDPEEVAERMSKIAQA